KGFFIPVERLESLIQEENVVGELSRCLPPHPGRNISELAKQICAMPTEETKSYRKIFAILVILEKVDQIENFLEEGVHDGDLPLIKVREKAIPAVLKRRCKSQGQEILCPLSCLSGFSLRDTMGFEDYQWAVLAPVFERPSRKDVRYYELEDQAILPFTEQSQPHEMCHGGFGQVSKVKIHPEHHRFSDLKNNYFAIKHLNSQDEQAFNAEFDMLSKFSGDAHDHLITLLAAYKQRNSFYLIFPWAEANLVQYWAKVKPKPDFKQAVVWVAMQCEGLVDGLRQIHKYESFPKTPGAGVGTQVKEHTKEAVDSSESSAKMKLYGRHGDIKPANVLWFPDLDDEASASDGSGTYGTLKLTDFGLSEFHTFDSRSNLSKSRIAASPSYRPPEYDMEQGRISRSYDIWTLGCLYLEFIAWLLGGWDLVKLFMVMRATTDNTGASERHHVKDHTFFELQEDGRDAKIKDSVTEFIKVKLHGHPLCSEYIHDFLDLIEEQMLVIETGDKASSRRIMCGSLHKRLQEMRQKCDNDPAYALTPAMRRKSSTRA
ncbi:kinase-like domain-containing protein, partial [Corynascus novoguineensis]